MKELALVIKVYHSKKTKMQASEATKNLYQFKCETEIIKSYRSEIGRLFFFSPPILAQA